MTNETPAVRERILEQAALLFVEHGYHGLSMREIAEAVGVSKAGLYYHFADKEQLFVAVLNRCMDTLEAALAAALPTQASGSIGIAMAIRGILQAIFAQPPEQRALMRVASSELGHLSAETRESFGKRYYRQFIGRIEATIRQGIALGELRDIEPHTATWILLGMAYPFFTPASMRTNTNTEQTIDAIVAVFLEGARKQ
jgi:AcrR family transcriptional regulator